MKKLCILGLAFLVSVMALAQEPIATAQMYQIHSSLLGESREIMVQLPKNYHNPDFAPSAYPVLYVLDGDFNFQLVAALERFNTKFLYRPHPEMIIVGIKNTDRTRDFTPTHVGDTGKGGRSVRLETSGGAGNFAQFIGEELKPFINGHFRTNGYDILHGHSFGGLFTLYTLLRHPGLFQGYIALDPSLWWDDQLLVKEAKKAPGIPGLSGKGLFVAMAGKEPEDEKGRAEHGASIREFCGALPGGKEEDPRQGWKYYPDYHHGSVPVPATLDALVFLFQGMELPVKEVPSRPEAIREAYGKLSQKLGFDFQPEESLLYDLIKYADAAGRPENADKILEYALELYPQSKQLQIINR